jgi:lambda repressor-like predicted transcriptional regulator
MHIASMHPEDVKAAIRKRFGTIAAFERAKSLPEKSVHDLFRGRASARVSKAVEDALSMPAPEIAESELSDCSANGRGSHRLISAAR